MREICGALAIKKIVGEVLDANIPSLKAFRRLGFEEVLLEDRIVFEKNIL